MWGGAHTPNYRVARHWHSVVINSRYYNNLGVKKNTTSHRFLSNMWEVVFLCKKTQLPRTNVQKNTTSKNKGSLTCRDGINCLSGESHSLGNHAWASLHTWYKLCRIARFHSKSHGCRQAQGRSAWDWVGLSQLWAENALGLAW